MYCGRGFRGKPPLYPPIANIVKIRGLANIQSFIYSDNKQRRYDDTNRNGHNESDNFFQ